MPYTGFVGPWPEGSDFESSTPGMWKELDHNLAKSVRLSAQSVDERNTTFPNPGANDRFIVDIPSLDQRHEWDGTRWLIFDYNPISVPGHWYTTLDYTGLNPGDGGSVTETYQRRGYWCDVTISTVRGSNSNVGAGAYYWFLTCPPADMLQTGTGRLRQSSTAEWACSVGLTDWNHVYMAKDGARVGTNTVSWGAGDQMLIQMTYRMKV